MANIILETHCHTIYSGDSLQQPAALVAACARKGIDRVVVTDHNKIAGALAAQAIDPQRVIVGEEIMTTQGELLAAFVQERVPPGLTPEETIAILRQQGAFISVSHPFDATRKGHWQPQNLEHIAPLVDAIETFNARCLTSEPNRKAAEFARRHGLPGTAGSDAHTSFELGRAVLSLPEFHDAATLRQAVAQAAPRTRLSSPFVHFTSRYASWYKKRYGS